MGSTGLGRGQACDRDRANLLLVGSISRNATTQAHATVAASLISQWGDRPSPAGAPHPRCRLHLSTGLLIPHRAITNAHASGLLTRLNPRSVSSSSYRTTSSRYVVISPLPWGGVGRGDE